MNRPFISELQLPCHALMMVLSPNPPLGHQSTQLFFCFFYTLLHHIAVVTALYFYGSSVYSSNLLSAFEDGMVCLWDTQSSKLVFSVKNAHTNRIRGLCVWAVDQTSENASYNVDVQQQMAIPDWVQPMELHNYIDRLPKPSQFSQLEQTSGLISNSWRLVVYCGRGCINSSRELREFVDFTGIPVATTLIGLGVFTSSDERCLHMLGMHGTMYANYSIDKSDLLLAFGVRCDDRATTSKLETFASRASIVHIDIHPAEIGKKKQIVWEYVQRLAPRHYERE